MEEKIRLAVFGQKRLSREGGIEIVVKELCTRMAQNGCDITCYNRAGHHVSGAEYDKTIEYDGIRQKVVPTIEKKGLAAVSSSFFAALCSAFGSIASSAYRWGADICSQMAAGVRAAASSVIAAAENVASRVRSLLHFSVPDEGPLSDADTYMPDFMKLLATGIKKNVKSVVKAVQGLAGSMSDNLTTPVDSLGDWMDSVVGGFATSVRNSQRGISSAAGDVGRGIQTQLMRMGYNAPKQTVSQFQLKGRYARQYLSFAGKSSKDFLLYLSGPGVYDSPAADVESTSVPGRNGDIITENKRRSYRMIGNPFPEQRLVSFQIQEALPIENGRVLDGTVSPTFALCRAEGSPSQNNPTPEEKADSGAM